MKFKIVMISLALSAFGVSNAFAQNDPFGMQKIQQAHQQAMQKAQQDMQRMIAEQQALMRKIDEQHQADMKKALEAAQAAANQKK